jgi:hypothetical protein
MDSTYTTKLNPINKPAFSLTILNRIQNLNKLTKYNFKNGDDLNNQPKQANAIHCLSRRTIIANLNDGR